MPQGAASIVTSMLRLQIRGSWFESWVGSSLVIKEFSVADRVERCVIDASGFESKKEQSAFESAQTFAHYNIS